MAQRLIDILKEMGYLTVSCEPNGRVAIASISARDAQYSFKKAQAMAVIKLRQIFTEAIAIYQAEELEREFEAIKKIKKRNIINEYR